MEPVLHLSGTQTPEKAQTQLRANFQLKFQGNWEIYWRLISGYGHG